MRACLAVLALGVAVWMAVIAHTSAAARPAAANLRALQGVNVVGSCGRPAASTRHLPTSSPPGGKAHSCRS
jgi:hypothetical protein